MAWGKDDWKKLVGAVAPGLATALGGPLAGVAVSAISDKLLGKPDGTEAEVAAVIANGGADALAKLREADQAFEVRLRELGIDLEKVHQADRADARGMAAKTGDVWTPRLLAFLVTVGFFGVLGWLLIGGKPTTGGDALLVMLGALGGAWGSIIAYYYGSSSSSAAKTELLAGRAKG